MDSEKPEREKLILERILTLKQILKEGDGGPLELHELGICYFNLGNYTQAANFLEELLESFPDYVELASVHALRIFCLIQEENFQEAERDLEERLKVQEQDTRLLAMLAHIYERRAEYEEAILIHRRILELDPDNLNSLNNLGYLLTLHGKPGEETEALRCLKRVIELKPDYPAYLDSFGVFLSKKGQKEGARKALLKALRKAPDNSVILDHLKELLGV